MSLTHLSLFTGIGGIDLAAEWAGFKTVAMVERDPYCQKVLRKHWPGVPILEDIFDVNRQTLADAQHSGWDGSTRPRDGGRVEQQQGRENQPEDPRESQASDTFTALRESRSNEPFTVDLVTGGFPCQPFSVAGKRRGKEDDRYLWPEMLRVIKEVRPAWVVAENVAGLIHMGLNDCLADLENAGFEVQTFLIPACAVNAPHRRDRIFIVGYSEHAGLNATQVARSVGARGNDSQAWKVKACQSEGPSEQHEVVADANGERPQGHGGLGECTGEWLTWTGSTPLKGIWKSEPPIRRVASGVPKRVDRLRALGNAVVPAQIYPILKAIADIERGPVTRTPQ